MLVCPLHEVYHLRLRTATEESLNALLLAFKRHRVTIGAMPDFPPTSVRTPTDPDEPDRTGRHEGTITPALFSSADAVEAGTIIAGKYKLLESIGEGGMGAVWMAQQIEPVKRLVAIKLIKAGMDSKSVIARFEAERQALSMMDHPNIARVFDVGATSTGRPFLVMELVKGTPITEFCDRRKMTPRERLELFVPVCQAIQHAHQKGIIHRDIKPSNVLVAVHDDKPVPKVIDFGVAKATGSPLTEKTLHTGFEQVVGTPAYMSPEQATFNQMDIDTRSDVYSLGVLLYELLTGSTPIERERFKKVALLEVLRVVREEEPPRPSTRLSATSTLPSIAANRHTEPATLSKLMKGELDWVVMKALEKDRTRRYETANGFAADVLRYLSGESVQAVPPSAGYRLRKFFRRNKAPVAVGAALAALLLLGTVSTSIGMAWALRAEEKAAAAAADEARQRTDAEGQRDRARKAEADATVSRNAAIAAGAVADAAREREFLQRYAGDMLLASRAVIEGPLARAVELLDVWLPEHHGGKDNRGREWHLLRRLCDTSERTMLGHVGPLRALAWSADGKRLASGGADRVIRVWEAATGRCVHTLVGHSAGVFDVAFSPDGAWLASASADSTVRLWELDSGQERHVLRGHILPVYAVAFHPDGKRLASAGGDAAIKLWDAAAGTEMFTLQGHEAAVGRLQFDATGSKLASSGIVRGTLIWNLATRKVVERLRPTGDIALTADFDTGVFAAPGGEIGILDVKASDISRGNPGVNGIHALDVSATARLVAIAGADDTIRVVDRETDSTLATHRGHIGPARRVVLRRDARKLASAGDDGAVRIWNVPDPNEPVPYSRHHEHNVTAASFSPDGSLLASGDYLGSIAVWNAQTGRRDVILGSHYLRRKSQPVPLEIGTGKPLDKGKTPLKSSTSFTAGATSRNPIVECFTTRGHSGEIRGVAFTPDKKTVVSIGAKDLIVWDLKSGKPLKEVEHPSLVSSLAVSPDGTLAATGCWDDIVRVFRLPSGELLKELEGHGDDVMCVAFSPSGKELATGGRDHTAIVWDVATGRIKHRLERHDNTVSALLYTPDGTRLVTGGMDKAIHVWNSESGKYESTLHGHTDGVTSLAFSADGKWLVSASDGAEDTAAKIWLWYPGQQQFRHGALIETAGSKGPTALAVHPLTGDLLIGRSQLTTIETASLVAVPPTAADLVAPKLLQEKAAAEGRLKVLGYAFVDEIAAWADGGTGRVKAGQPGTKFLVVATSLPFGKLKLGDTDYQRLIDIKKKDPDATEPLKFSTMLIDPKRFVLAGGEAKPISAQYVGRMATTQAVGFEFMKKNISLLEMMTLTPQPDDREHVYLGWEVGKDFTAAGLRLRFDAEEAVAIPTLELESFRPGKPFHSGSRSFDAGEGGTRLRSNVTRSTGP